ncbi:ABC transporter substrate-binding protein [Saccharopolyspora phatthalungensis]|uniref:Peptide/nickel transport system substrate-binding protein n=1 Tax=Saccharopolyspora phatthalungensis TaxID=664693 RepID=A0A840QHA2_9PSEU|nr:ABC transporter substrate-binding protein [Saccharopolyspora phatthalungensis]MBB5159360.1 peptide/nickel transport system substrate-binding protein [Saccharopolyspora phatthalungensis]
MSTADISRRSFLALSAAATAVLAAGCGGTDSTGKAAGAITLAQSTEPNLAALMQVVSGNSLWQHLVFDYLTELDDTRTPQPRLAESWTPGPDLRTLTLRLREDVVFHTGRPMTADDVVFSLQQAAIPKNGSQLTGVAQQIASMTPQGTHGLEITLKEPSNRLFELFETTPIVDKDTFAKAADGKNLVGTGPFRWNGYRAGDSIELAANSQYWGGKPALTSASVLIIKQSQALIAAARSRRTQITDGLTPLDAGTVRGGQLRVENRGGIQCYVLGLDASKPPFDDIRARQAVAVAVDRERIVSQIYRNTGTVTNLWWPKNTPGWDAKTDARWRYDPDRARAALRDLGLEGASVPVTANSGDLIGRAIFDIVRYNLEDVGLRIEPNILESAAFINRNVAGALGTCFVHTTGFGSLSPVACVTATAHLKPNGGTHFSSPEYTRLIKAASTAGEDTRAAANAALGSYLVEQAFNLPLVIAPPPMVVDSEVRDLRITTAFRYLLPQSLSYR